MNVLSWPVSQGVNYFIRFTHAASTGTFAADVCFTLSAAPGNDLFANRWQLTGTEARVSGHNLGATTETDEPVLNGQVQTNWVWWTWTAPSSGYVEIGVQSLGSLVANVFRGTQLSQLRLTNQGSRFDAEAGQSYQIAVCGMPGGLASGAFTLELRQYPNQYRLLARPQPAIGGLLDIQPPPAAGSFLSPGTLVTLKPNAFSNMVFRGWSGGLTNSDAQIALFMNHSYDLTALFSPVNDQFADRSVLIGTNIEFTGTVAGATSELGEPTNQLSYPTMPAASVWYSWTAPADGFAVLELAKDTSAQFAVYTGADLAHLAVVDLITRPGTPPTEYQDRSLAGFQTHAGIAYQIAITGRIPEEHNQHFQARLTLDSQRYRLTLNVVPPNSGAIWVNPLPDSDGLYLAGTKVVLTNQPAPGMVFDAFSGDVLTNMPSGPYPSYGYGMTNPTTIEIHVTTNKQIIATFVKDPLLSAGRAPIPAGSFTMGDPFNEGSSGEYPTHTVNMSAFHIDTNLVTKAVWNSVYNWASAHLTFFGARTFLSALVLISRKRRTRMSALQTSQVVVSEKSEMRTLGDKPWL